jgi:hypothetical protein
MNMRGDGRDSASVRRDRAKTDGIYCGCRGRHHLRALPFSAETSVFSLRRLEYMERSSFAQ